MRNPDAIGTIESYIEGPRWALPAGTVRKFAMNFRLKMDYERRETSLIQATIFFKVHGRVADLERFQKAFQQAVAEHNR